jgi:beta-carotene 3-hydroxylase
VSDGSGGIVAIVSAVAIALVSFLAMEPLTAAAHRWVMHGVGRRLHRSHHRRLRPGQQPRWEANDWFPVMFASVVLIGFALGFNVAGFEVLVPVGIGITAYGATYAIVHDLYIHQRLPLFRGRRIPVLEWLAASHRVHHERNAAPYGMLLPVRSGSRPSHVPREP